MPFSTGIGLDRKPPYEVGIFSLVYIFQCSKSINSIVLRSALIMIWNLYLCSLLLFSVRVESKLQKLQELFAWNVLDFEYASDFDRVNAMQSQKYVPENNLPVGIEVWRDKLFISVPRWRAGRYLLFL